MARAGVGPLVGNGARTAARAARAAANAARDRGDSARAAGFYGRYLEQVPGAGGIWLQHGNMLKDAGLLAHAQDSYERAFALAPSDPEVRVQMAILAKVRGDFDAALERYGEAAQLGYADPAFLEAEIGFIRQSDNRRRLSLFVSRIAEQADQPACRIYFSSAIGLPPPETARDLETFLGAVNYSYGFSMKGYLEALDRLGLAYEVIRAPEYVADVRARDKAAVNLHFGFYPPDQPRFLKGAYNVLVMAWEFERLRRASEDPGDHAFNDPAAMVGLADEVWMVSRFGAEAVERSGVARVTAVPSPVLGGLSDHARAARPSAQGLYRAAARYEHVPWVPLATGPFLRSRLMAEAKSKKSTLRSLVVENIDDGPPVFFLTILNMYDYRKQIKPAIEAFIDFSRRHRNAYMLLKISYIDTGDLNETLHNYQIADISEVAPPLVSDRIWLTDYVFTREELNGLYDMSAFYVCTSHGEGQNLPLLEAMGRGVVPLSVDHTAMRDYLSGDNAVIIPSTLAPFNARLRTRYKMGDVNTYYVAARDARDGFERAASLDDASYAALSAAAWETVRTKFGYDRLRAPLEQVIARALARFASDEPAS